MSDTGLEGRHQKAERTWNDISVNPPGRSIHQNKGRLHGCHIFLCILRESLPCIVYFVSTVHFISSSADMK